MVKRRMVAVIVASVLATAASIVTGGVAGADHKPVNFDKLKLIKEPASCDEPDQGITDDTIKVGVISILSGPQATSFAPSTMQGIEARVERANTTGELGDRQIELLPVDDAADPARNLTAAQQLNEEEQVFGVISQTNVAKGGAEYLHEEGVPVTGWHIGEGVWGIYENMFSWRPSQPPDPRTTFTLRTAEVLKELGAKKIAVVGSNSESSAVNTAQTVTAVENTKGLKLVYDTADVTPEQQDFTGIAAQIKDSGADGLYMAIAGLQASGLLQALDQAGVELKVRVLPGGYDDRAAGLAGYEGSYVGTEFAPLEVNAPGHQQYIEDMEALGYDPLRFFSIHGYLGANMFIEGIKAAGVGCPTREAFINNLRLLEDYDLDGFFVPADYAKVFGRPQLCIYYLQIEDAAFVPIFDGEPFCASHVSDDGKIRKVKKSERAIG